MMTDTIQDQILQMYQSGCSQKEIRHKLNLSVARIRATLLGAGFDTRNYRRMDRTMIRVIDVLVSYGVYYRDIELYCDIDQDATRQHVSRHGRLMTGHLRTYKEVGDDALAFPGFATFLRRYDAGESFSRLVDDLGFTDTKIYDVFWYLWSTKDTKSHAANMRKRILQQLAAGYSPSAVARREHISVSLAKAYGMTHS